MVTGCRTIKIKSFIFSVKIAGSYISQIGKVIFTFWRKLL